MKDKICEWKYKMRKSMKTECGHEWKGQKAQSIWMENFSTCPHCGGKIKTTRV